MKKKEKKKKRVSILLIIYIVILLLLCSYTAVALYSIRGVGAYQIRTDLGRFFSKSYPITLLLSVVLLIILCVWVLKRIRKQQIAKTSLKNITKDMTIGESGLIQTYSPKNFSKTSGEAAQTNTEDLYATPETSPSEAVTQVMNEEDSQEENSAKTASAESENVTSQPLPPESDETVVMEESNSSEPVKMQYRYCTQCGCKLPLDAKFCTNCGAKTEETE